jgi:hypothetical protein
MHYRRFLLIAAAIVLPEMYGCGNSASLSGNVAFNGQPVTNGQITLLPEDGKGPVVGGPITDGRYRVENVTPGQKTVQIIGVKKVSFAQSHEEMATAAKNAAKKGDGSGIIDRADVIPADAEGNKSVIEVKPGNQTFDFSLKAPVPK